MNKLNAFSSILNFYSTLYKDSNWSCQFNIDNKESRLSIGGENNLMMNLVAHNRIDTYKKNIECIFCKDSLKKFQKSLKNNNYKFYTQSHVKGVNMYRAIHGIPFNFFTTLDNEEFKNFYNFLNSLEIKHNKFFIFKKFNKLLCSYMNKCFKFINFNKTTPYNFFFKDFIPIKLSVDFQVFLKSINFIYEYFFLKEEKVFIYISYKTILVALPFNEKFDNCSIYFYFNNTQIIKNNEFELHNIPNSYK